MLSLHFTDVPYTLQHSQTAQFMTLKGIQPWPSRIRAQILLVVFYENDQLLNGSFNNGWSNHTFSLFSCTSLSHLKFDSSHKAILIVICFKNSGKFPFIPRKFFFLDDYYIASLRISSWSMPPLSESDVSKVFLPPSARELFGQVLYPSPTFPSIQVFPDELTRWGHWNGGLHSEQVVVCQRLHTCGIVNIAYSEWTAVYNSHGFIKKGS